MSENSNTHKLVCKYFTWKIFRRNRVYYADGRSGKPNLGKHSLGTRDQKEALENLRKLDVKKAIDHGLAKPTEILGQAQLPVMKAWELFMQHCNRPLVMGGVSPNTYKRYRAVRDKHLQFCSRQQIDLWDEIDKNSVQEYGHWLQKTKYADRTIYLELTLLKSLTSWLIEEGHLPQGIPIRLKLQRPTGTDTYCYCKSEVTRMLQHCRESIDLAWLADVILALACTGLRISELASLRWSDIDWNSKTIHLTDERGSSRRRVVGEIRTTKNKRSRTIPIHPQLADTLSKIDKNRDGRIFHGPRGGKLKPDTVRNIFIRNVINLLKEKFPTPENEIGFEHGRLHSFRHYFVSQAFLYGASEGEIMEWVGHRDSKMVSHYRHLRNEDSQRRMQQIDFIGNVSESDDAESDPPEKAA